MPIAVISWKTGSIVFEYGILPDRYEQMITGEH